MTENQGRIKVTVEGDELKDWWGLRDGDVVEVDQDYEPVAGRLVAFRRPISDASEIGRLRLGVLRALREGPDEALEWRAWVVQTRYGGPLQALNPGGTLELVGTVVGWPRGVPLHLPCNSPKCVCPESVAERWPYERPAD